MQSICVIGGSGFIGTRLVRRLSHSSAAPVVIIDKSASQTFPELTQRADIRSPSQLRESIPDNSIIIHLAAEHRDDVKPRSLYDDVNVDGTRNICSVAQEKGINTIVFTSSVAVYGFAPIGTDENGQINPFNDYGRTKYAAEQVLRQWQAEDPHKRRLIIIRPTVVFGEQNRGNVYNLLRQIAAGSFVMVGHGENRKSMAYVENLVEFIEYSLNFKPGVHLYNYIDKPDYTMNALVAGVNRTLARSSQTRWRLPYFLGFTIGLGFDFLSWVTGKRYTISSIRVKKFCADTVFNTSAADTGFKPSVTLEQAIEKTVRYEFVESHQPDVLYYTE
jgi:GlcNAc-P-P-Und epimerase